MSHFSRLQLSPSSRAAIVVVTLSVLALPVLSWAARHAAAQSSAGQDERAVRACRSIIAVINPATTEIDVTSTLRIGEANAIAISYISRPTTGRPRSRKLVCSFKDKGGALDKSRELVNVVADGDQLGPARMRFLQRFWIGSREAEDAAIRLDASKRR